ncbi:putative integrase family protein [Gammaproteobacteria bacterium]
MSHHSLATITPSAASTTIDAGVLAKLEHYARHATGAFAKNTERAIKADVARFTAFCAERGLSSLPATPETLVAFLEALIQTHATASVRRYLSSIATFHKAAGLESPTGSLEVRLAMKRLTRTKGTRQRQAGALNRGLVDKMLLAHEGTLRDRRDLAILAVAYDTLCRRSEIAALMVGDFSFANDGTGTILVRKSKTDQEGADTVVMVKEWLNTAGHTQGAMFRGVNNAGGLEERLSEKGVNRAFKRFAKRIGADVKGISGHSCRVGAAQDMVAAGLEIGEVMQAGGLENTRYGCAV